MYLAKSLSSTELIKRLRSLPVLRNWERLLVNELKLNKSRDLTDLDIKTRKARIN